MLGYTLITTTKPVVREETWELVQDVAGVCSSGGGGVVLPSTNCPGHDPPSPTSVALMLYIKYFYVCLNMKLLF